MKYTIKIKICQVLVISGLFSLSSFASAQNNNGYYDPAVLVYKPQSVIVCHQPNRDCFSVTVRPADWQRILMPKEQYFLDMYKYSELQKKVSVPVVQPDKNPLIPKSPQPTFILNGDAWDEMRGKTNDSMKKSADDGELLKKTYGQIKDIKALEPIWKSLIDLNAKQEESFENLGRLLHDPVKNRIKIDAVIVNIKNRMKEIQENLKKLDAEAAFLENGLAVILRVPDVNIKIPFVTTEAQFKAKEDDQKKARDKNKADLEKLKIMRQSAQNAIESLSKQQFEIDDSKARMYKSGKR